MTTWLAIGLCVAVFALGVIADDVDFDFPENVNSRFGGSRIVSGWEAVPGQLPHQSSIRMINSNGQVSACGGSVIHPQWVMTAAHCTASRIIFVVRAGVVNLTQPEYITETSEFYNHPTYNNNLPSVVQPNDIGLLKLERLLTFSNNLQPIRLQPSMHMNRNYDAERLVASGWGNTWTQGTSPENLNWVYLLGIANFDCWVQYGFSSIITDATICARYYNVTSQSTCQGDSGGPLTVIDEDGKRTMIGVASFVSGQGCHTTAPAGFIRPGPFHDWILEITGINFDWDWESEEKSSSEQDKTSSEEDKTSSEQDKTSSEEDKTSSEQDKSSSEQDKTSSEQDKTSSEQDKTSSEQDKTSSEQDKTSSEQDKTSSEQDKTSSEQDKTSSEQDKTSSEQDKTSSEQDKSSSEQDKTSSEEDKTSSEQDKTSSEEDKTSSEQDKTSSEQDKTSSEQDKSGPSEQSSSEEHKPEPPSSEEHKPEPPSSEEHKPEPPSSEEHNPGWPSSEEVAKGSRSWFGKSDRI